MPLFNSYDLKDCPAHVTSRSNNREVFPLPLNRLWPIFEDYLYLMKIGFNLKIHSFVLMPNHFHLLVSAPCGNLSNALQFGVREISREIGRKTATRNHQFGGRCHQSVITSYHYFLHAYKYVYRNPIKAGLTKFAQEYPHSTLCGLTGFGRLNIPVENDLLLIEDFERTLLWLNRSVDPQHDSQIKTALRRGQFRLPKDSCGRRSQLEDRLF